MKAILYTSNTGYTKQYAYLLSESTKLPVYSLKEAREFLKNGDEIIYMGWLTAGIIQGYKKAKKKYVIKASVGVGMADPESQIDSVRKANALPDEMPLYILQGGFDMDKLRGLSRLMMKIAVPGMIKGLTEKPDRTIGDDITLKLLREGGGSVNKESLYPIESWYKESLKALN